MKRNSNPAAVEIASASNAPTYIDVFAGCGGLSLGLKRAGWQGLFAIERDVFAFDTLKANFLQEDSRFRYDWPSWLKQEALAIEHLLSIHKEQLVGLRGKVDLLAGGPPCQGFSTAGRRQSNDPRNAMVERYLELVDLIEPNILLLENVRGFMQDFKAEAKAIEGARENFAAKLTRRLSSSYSVESILLSAAEYGVPQNRPRFILVGVRKGSGLPEKPLGKLGRSRDPVLKRYGIKATVTAKQAISDLEVGRNELVSSKDSLGFEAIGYRRPFSNFQVAMRDGFTAAPSDTRLAKHNATVRERFSDIIEHCRAQNRSTRSLPATMREKLGLKKQAIRVLDPAKPAPTVTSMPDDLIHYSEPRTLTVRENARLQTFPDWFVFRGKYTTGGHLRRTEVPRFTQVANAVPPLLAEILGECLKTYCWSPVACSSGASS